MHRRQNSQEAWLTTFANSSPDDGDTYHWNEIKAHKLSPNAIYAVGVNVDGPEGSFVGKVFKSNDDGITWSTSLSLLFHESELTSLDFDESDPAIIFVTGGTTSIGFPARVYKSTNAGTSWHQLPNPGMSNANAILVDPTSSGNSRTIYVAGSSIKKSTDDGSSWFDASLGTGGATSIVISPAEYKVLFGGNASGVYRTQSGGNSWQQVKSGIDVTSLMLHAKNTQTVYASSSDQAYQSHIFRTTDNGMNWAEFVPASNIPHGALIHKMSVDVLNPNRVYCATDSGVYSFTHRWSGELSASATWYTGNEYIVEGTLTVPAGVTLTIQQGTNVKFMQNAELNVDGVLNADAAGGAPISFAPYTSGLLWNGISFGTSSGSIVRNANITGAQTGISARHNIGLIVDDCIITDGGTGVYLYSASGGGSVGTAILNNTISNMPILAGVYVDAGASLAIIQDNTITGPGSYGMYFVQASPVDVVRNKTSGFDKAGIYCYSASPSFVNALLGGHNCSFSNDIGVWAKYKAYPNLGSTVMSASGVNTISLNASFAIMLQDNCDVNAEDDWFDEDGPDAHDFSVDASSTLSFEPFLTGQDPNGCIGGSAPLAGGGTEGKNEEGMATGLLDNPLARQAMTFRLQRRHHEAMNLLKAIIASRQSGERLIEWAMSELLANYQMISAPGGNDRLSRYLRTTLQNTSNNRIARTIRDVVAGASLHEGDRSGMNAALDDAIRLHPNTESEVLALYQKISAAMNAGDMSSARAALQTLTARYPRHELTHAASALVGAQGGGTAPLTSIKKSGGSLASGSPLTFGLEQNFPNPFNPSTIILFAIPQTEHVTLKVYDLLGREVATLVNEARTAGNHEAFFDASNLASGVYIYRLTAGNFIATKKFTLIK